MYHSAVLGGKRGLYHAGHCTTTATAVLAWTLLTSCRDCVATTIQYKVQA